MFNRSELEDAIVPGLDGEWDEPNDRVHSHKTTWEDFNESLRPKWRYVSSGLRWKILLKCGHACVHCGATDDLQVDHIKPVSHGGSDEEDNLQILCRLCNQRKGGKSESRWIKWDP